MHGQTVRGEGERGEMHLVRIEEGEKVPDEGREGGDGTLDDGHDRGGRGPIGQEQPAREGAIAAPHGC